MHDDHCSGCCDPVGNVSYRKCGDCGAQNRTCNATCQWDPPNWNTCYCFDGCKTSCTDTCQDSCYAQYYPQPCSSITANGSYTFAKDEGDYYCEAGTWTSRTKLIALQLWSLAVDSGGTDYTLFCGEYDEVLNFLNYGIKQDRPEAGEYAAKTNNYCILDHSNGIAFGTSLNEEIDEIYDPIETPFVTTAPFIEAVGLDVGDCDGATDDGNYYPCSNNVWYNKKLESVIYSKSITTTTLPQTYPSSTFDAPLSTSIAMLETNLDNKQKFSLSSLFTNRIKKFRNLYYHKKGTDKSILGAMEGPDIVIKYENFNTNICEMTNNYHELPHFGVNNQDGSVHTGIVCLEDTTDYYVWAYGTQHSSDPTKIWPDLTSKLRIS